jgi:hypothetical protein
VLPNDLLGPDRHGVRMFVLILVIGFFGWPYIGRIVRGQTLSLREREYVEAARSLGAGRRYILFRELLPNLVAPILVYTTLMIPTNILTEAALSFLGVGVKPPTASWGRCSRSGRLLRVDPMYMIIPGVAIFITVLAFNLFGDGVRDALDPKAPAEHPARQRSRMNLPHGVARYPEVGVPNAPQGGEEAWWPPLPGRRTAGATAACGGGGSDDDGGTVEDRRAGFNAANNKVVVNPSLTRRAAR